MKLAVVGCGHGSLDLIYKALIGHSVDALLVCGDFEACRNELDLNCLAGPSKYHFLKDYWEYYKGTKVAPVLTLFVGGNHEASNHLWELYFGGWAAPNIYYLGNSGVVKIGDLRIAGISGIYDSRDYHKGHHERVPYNDSTVRSVYHTRECEVWKLKHLTGKIDAFISHDWPMDVALYGDLPYLYRRNGGLKAQVESRTFGSPGSLELMQQLKPTYWLAGHMHVKYHAAFPHPDSTFTNFLALSKAWGSERSDEFLHIVDFPDKTAGPLTYDEEWLAILRSTHHMTFFQQTAKVPHRVDFDLVQKHVPAVRERFSKREGGYQILQKQFELSAPPSPLRDYSFVLPSEFTQNTQTVKFIMDLGLPFPGFETEEIQKPAEFVALKCGVCKKDFSIPREAADYFQAKKLAPPSKCKECSKKQSVVMNWR